MAKKGTKKHSPKRARREFEEALTRLHLAEEEYAAVQAEGEQRIEKARVRAAQLLDKAAARIARRQQAVLAAESRLQALERPRDSSQEPETEELIIVVPGEEPTADHVGLRDRELRALQALQHMFNGSSVSAGDWRAAAKQTATTFARARDVLVEQGLVVRLGENPSEIRYLLTPSGRAAGA